MSSAARTGQGSHETDSAPSAPSPIPSATSLRFSRESRLLQRSEYDAVFKSNRRYVNHHWTMLVHANVDPRPGRLGLAIAKKRARRAVDRNRIKRVAREAFRHRASALAGIDLVIMNRDAATSASTVELRRSFDHLLGQVVPRGGRAACC